MYNVFFKYENERLLSFSKNCDTLGKFKGYFNQT